MSELGKGTPAMKFETVSGRLRRFDSPADVIASLDSDLESTIALVASGGTTFLSPILGRLRGVICQDGTLRSHLAIVSRDFELPCLVGAELVEVPENGTMVTLEVRSPNLGVVFRAEG
ncbi:MAG: hypothetical protein L0H83_14165 [Salinisphaera sp.]|nr:hypothetical protein [Salinisphaera sp.]